MSLSGSHLLPNVFPSGCRTSEIKDLRYKCKVWEEEKERKKHNYPFLGNWKQQQYLSISRPTSEAISLRCCKTGPSCRSGFDPWTHWTTCCGRPPATSTAAPTTTWYRTGARSRSNSCKKLTPGSSSLSRNQRSQNNNQPKNISCAWFFPDMTSLL